MAEDLADFSASASCKPVGQARELCMRFTTHAQKVAPPSNSLTWRGGGLE